MEVREQSLEQERMFAVSALEREAGAILEADGIRDLAL